MKKVFVSLDRQTRCVGTFAEPDRYRDIERIDDGGFMIPQGAAVSYVAASFGDATRSIGMLRFNRILGFDAAARWIEVEAGANLGEVYDFLLSHKLVLPVQPGHPQITIGGCIAGNVSGKNQLREGLFGDHVESLRLFHPAHGFLDLSRQHNPELFALTIGGFGLTGIIVSARLRLTPLASAAVAVEHIPVGGLDEAFEAVERLAGERDMAYAWIDLANHARPGAGFIVAGDAVPATGPAVAQAWRRLAPSERHWRPRRFTRNTIPTINRLYRHLNLRGGRRKIISLFDFVFPAVGKEWYFDAFGEQGFVEAQVLVPVPAAAQYGCEILRLLRKHDVTVALATLKRFGGVQSNLHFGGAGFNFGMDIVLNASTNAFLGDLDALNLEMGAIASVLKDSHLGAAAVARQYPGYEAFRRGLAAFDPARRFASSLSRRLEL